MSRYVSSLHTGKTLTSIGITNPYNESMYLLVNTLFPTATVLLAEDGHIVARRDFVAKGREYETLLPEILALLADTGLTWDTIGGIVAVTGPGPFTGTRIVILTLNSIAFVCPHLHLEGIDIWTLGEGLGWYYPMIMKINRGEYLMKPSVDQGACIVPISDIPEGRYSGIGDEKDFTNTAITIQCDKDYATFIRWHIFSGSRERLTPRYCKEPNIT